MVKKSKGFTLVELLAVIVILAVILVIAVPQIISTITESRKGALASSAKLIASSAESAYMSNQTLGIEKDITCSDVAQLTSEDYTSCSIKFVDGKAKVKIIGQGKFEGMAVCSGTKENAEVVEECPRPVSFSADSWATIVTAVQEGDTSNYNVGDTKTVDLGSLGTHTLRIANKTACDGTLASQTACGFVVEFADIITTHNMNPSGEYNGTTYQYGWNKDGWPGSQMYDYINVTEETGSGTIYNALPEELRNAIIDTKVVSSLGSEDKSREEGNFVSTDKLYLLSPEEVYGTSFTNSYDTSRGTSRQLDWYEENGVTTSSYSNAIKNNAGSASSWWLRSAYSNRSNSFWGVNSIGDWNAYGASYTYGVSPAFRLG